MYASGAVAMSERFQMQAYIWTHATGHTPVGDVYGDTVEQLMQEATTAAERAGLSGTLCLYKPGEQPPLVDTRITRPSREMFRSYENSGAMGGRKSDETLRRQRTRRMAAQRKARRAKGRPRKS